MKKRSEAREGPLFRGFPKLRAKERKVPGQTEEVYGGINTPATPWWYGLVSLHSGFLYRSILVDVQLSPPLFRCLPVSFEAFTAYR